MIDIKFMQPFYTKSTEKNIRLVFAYKYLSFVKGEELYQFIPIEGKEIVINLETGQPENLSEVFVFQCGNRFIRLPLYHFFLVSNAMEFVKPYIGNEMKITEVYKADVDSDVEEQEVEEIILRSLIDRALDVGDKSAFMELSGRLKRGMK